MSAQLPENLPTADRFIRLPEVLHLTALSRTSIYEQIQQGTFPKQYRISKTAVAWRLSEVQNWMQSITGADDQEVQV
jgi:prophage regulatory protein